MQLWGEEGGQRWEVGGRGMGGGTRNVRNHFNAAIETKMKTIQTGIGGLLSWVARSISSGSLAREGSPMAVRPTAVQ